MDPRFLVPACRVTAYGLHTRRTHPTGGNRVALLPISLAEGYVFVQHSPSSVSGELSKKLYASEQLQRKTPASKANATAKVLWHG